jgi:DNA-binding beta-propeller fold protein YncE
MAHLVVGVAILAAGLPGSGWAAKPSSPAGPNNHLPLWGAQLGDVYQGSNALAVGPGGTRIFVTGAQAGPDYGTVAYVAGTGEQVWIATYDGPAHLTDVAHGIGVSPMGDRVFVTGDSDGTDLSDTDYATIAYDSGSGQEEWVARFDGGANQEDLGFRLAVDPTGDRVFVTGESVDATADIVTIAYDAATGAQLWVDRYDGPAHDVDMPTGIRSSPDGSRVFVTGGIDGVRDFGTIAYDAATGARLWVAIYDNASDQDYPFDLAVGPDGATVYVTGFSAPGDLDEVTIAYDATNGAQRWRGVYQTATGQAVTVNPSGDTVFVTGDMATTAFDAATGTLRWVHRFGTKYTYSGHAIAVSPDGSAVFATGSAYPANPSTEAFLTVKYDAASGAPQWVAWSHRPRPRLPFFQEPHDLGLSPNGTLVYVTGTNIYREAAYLTFAYRA